MKIRLPNTHRLHSLRMANDEAGQRMEAMRPRFDRLGDRHTNGAAPVAVSAYQLFQTPEPLAACLVAALELGAGARVLEPSAGLGRILSQLQEHGAGPIVACESAAECARHLFATFPDVTLWQRDFLSVAPDGIAPFDAVAMNPPFHMRTDIRHIEHALKFLRPGGRLAALCLDTHHREAALRHRANTWTPIPAGTFKGEGTRVATILLTIDKPHD